MNDERYVVQKAESTDDDFSFVDVIAVGEPHCVRSCCFLKVLESFYLLHGHRSNLLRFGDALFLVRAILKEAKGLGGRPVYDYVMMFKIIILQKLYNISDEQTEYQINDPYK